MPAKYYDLYLREEWLQVHIKTLAQRGTMPFQDYSQFIDICDESALEDRAKVAEFYLHNMSLIDMNIWDPNA